MMKMQISFTINGEDREGGYKYITSPDLTGFRLLVGPGEDEIEAMRPVLQEHLIAYFAAGQKLPDGVKIEVSEITPAPRARDFRKAVADHRQDKWWHGLISTGGLPMVANVAAA